MLFRSGADSVVGAVLETVGYKGTLLAPTNIFNGYVTDFLRKVTEVDLNTLPSKLGAVSEAVRKFNGSVRSCHPTHPVAAIGALADDLLGEHHMGDSAAGALSPYGKLALLSNGKILMAGVTNGSNTTFHTAEEYYAPYIFNGEVFSVRTIDNGGKACHVRVKGYCTGIRRNFTAADPYLIEAGCMRSTIIGNAKVILLNSMGVIETLKCLLEKNSMFLVHDNSFEKYK